MLSTFINENMNAEYPFYRAGALPFPNSCILGIQIAICYSDLSGAAHHPGQLYVSSITLSENAAYMVICGTYNSNAPIMSISAYKQGHSGTSTVIQNICKDPKVFVNGFVELGSIPEEAYGLYTGKFWIDPSCISFVPQKVMRLGIHNIMVGDTPVDTDQCLNIHTAGLLKSTLGRRTDTPTYNINIDTDAMNNADLYTLLDERNYNMVNSINGVSTATDFTKNGSTLSITSGSNSIELSATQNGNAIIVSIKGNNQFKNCFKQTADGPNDPYLDAASSGV